jgi:hypothetical protein
MRGVLVMKPARIQLRRTKGWRMPPNTLKVDRTTKWGNPFRPNQRHDKAYCAKLFEYMAGGYICMIDKPSPDEQRAYLKMAKKNIGQLRGKNLACWCKAGDSCHADVLLRIANKGRKK